MRSGRAETCCLTAPVALPCRRLTAPVALPRSARRASFSVASPSAEDAAPLLASLVCPLREQAGVSRALSDELLFGARAPRPAEARLALSLAFYSGQVRGLAQSR